MRKMTAFMDTIPRFMRRPQERAAVKLGIKYGTRTQAVPVPPGPRDVIHGGVPPVQPDFLALDAAETAEPLNSPGTAADDSPHRVPATGKNISPELPAADGGVVDLTARRSAAAQTETAPGEMNRTLYAAFEAESGDFDGDDDVAFQVTLPRSVIRQIRVFAAEQGTTHRAVVLRALRGAGLNIPEGADVDRRAVAAKRRHQA